MAGYRRPTDPADAMSPEVRWYLESRGVALPTCAPSVKTPEPRDVPGARFDPERVDKVVFDVFPRLMHTQGQWARRPLKPDPWQIAYILAPVYGWVRENDNGDWVRIIRTEYVDIPRKNGKSTIGGGQAIYLTAADGEQGAQVFAAGTAKDQARYVFDPIRALAEKSPALKGNLKVTTSRIVHPKSGSYFAVVSSMADLLHGANVHGAIVDELHKHKSREMLDAIQTGTGARTQPLVIIVTTADDGKPNTIYAETRGYAESLARGTFTDPTFYGVVFAADKDDDPFVEATWKKANPGYGISPTREFLEAEAAKAQNSPANLAKFKRLHLGLRTKQETKFIDLDVWDRNSSLVVESALVGRDCYGGLDLATTTDLCALALDFPDGDGGHDALWRLWIPEEAFGAMNERTAGAAEVWRAEGFLTVMDGAVADYDFIHEQINRDRALFNLRQVAYDPWNSSQLVQDLMKDGLELVEHRQGFASMSPPTKELLRLLLEGTAEKPRYRHGGNPSLRWQIDNLAVKMDPAGNVKPDKSVAADKIDGVAAAIMALHRAMLHAPARVSVYETRGMEVV